MESGLSQKARKEAESALVSFCGPDVSPDPRTWSLGMVHYLLNEIGRGGDDAVSPAMFKWVQERGFNWKEIASPNMYPEAVLRLDAYARLDQIQKERI